MNTGPALPTVDTCQNFFSITATKVIMYTQMKHQTESQLALASSLLGLSVFHLQKKKEKNVVF